MKRFVFSTLTFFLLAAISASASFAAPLGRATDSFDNARPQNSETSFGRLVADAMRDVVRADIALINGGSFKPGVLQAGEVSGAQVDALLAFPRDEVATLTITGAQLRAALERAVQAYPTRSTAFLHGSGFSAMFNTQAPTNNRLTMLRIAGREVQNEDSITVAMPAPLAEGGSGYFTIWANARATRSGVTISQAIADLIKTRGTISPERTPRLGPQ